MKQIDEFFGIGTEVKSLEDMVIDTMFRPVVSDMCAGVDTSSPLSLMRTLRRFEKAYSILVAEATKENKDA